VVVGCGGAGGIELDPADIGELPPVEDPIETVVSPAPLVDGLIGGGQTT
jgi:hypothetical protein